MCAAGTNNLLVNLLSPLSSFSLQAPLDLILPRLTLLSSLLDGSTGNCAACASVSLLWHLLQWLSSVVRPEENEGEGALRGSGSSSTKHSLPLSEVELSSSDR